MMRQIVADLRSGSPAQVVGAARMCASAGCWAADALAELGAHVYLAHQMEGRGCPLGDAAGQLQINTDCRRRLKAEQVATDEDHPS